MTLPASRRLYERAVVKVVKSLGWRQPISWNSSPLDFSWRIGRLLRASVDVLHLTDAFWEYPGFGPDQRRHLRAAAQSADVVVCTTDSIRDGVVELATPKRAPKVVGHGVDVNRFSPAIDRPPPEGPITAVFVGRLDRRLDIDLVESLARAGVRVVLVGPSTLPAADGARLRAAGCELPGEVPYDALSAWMAGADVGIVPYQLVPSVVASRPLKLLEYLAAGLPVVTTPLPAAAELSPHAVVADRDGFIDAVRAVGAAERARGDADRSQVRNGRVSRVRSESWERRAQELSAVIEEARSNG
ncbi:MAG TPA: glycosyltransferase [Acidimicrobiales bacterium]|nr:glycosyltransferase [Acidimicrobiales bacterium]